MRTEQIGTGISNFIDKEAEVREITYIKSHGQGLDPDLVANKDVCPPIISQY